MSTLKSLLVVETLAVGALAGVAGGMAEVVWIVVYGSVTGAPTASVAYGIVKSVVPDLAASSWSAPLGMLIHLALAIALGLALACILWVVSRRVRTGSFELGLVMLVLAAVWAVSFLIALPHINPAFVHLLPYGVTLSSKLLFGLAAAAVFRINGVRSGQLRAC